VTSPRLRGPAPCGLSRDADLAENELGQEHSSKDRHRNTQKGADQKVFREAFGLEFPVARDGFCSGDQADRRGGLNDQKSRRLAFFLHKNSVRSLGSSQNPSFSHGATRSFATFLLIFSTSWESKTAL
jgi:hypothetical protein